MRTPFAPFAALCLLAAGLSACNTTQFASTAANITNDIGLACNSANQLLSLPGTQAGLAAGAGAIAISAAKLSSKMNLYCTGAQIAAPILTTALSQVNTSAAQLLGTGVAKK